MKVLLILFLILSCNLSAKDTGAEETSNNSNTKEGTAEAEKTVKEGILSFPVSQQPGPMISFGQNIFDKKTFQAFVLAYKVKGDDRYGIFLNPNVIYAFTDSFSIYIANLVTVRNRIDDTRSTGAGDSTVQLEHAFYTMAYKRYYEQATLVANVTIPTGSSSKNPPTGFGANSFFVGGTYERTGVDWYGFTSHGGLINTSAHQTEFGNEFLYQFGFGRRILNTKEWLFMWMVEFDGTYSWKDKIHGKIDPNTGGNVIIITPSLWLSSSESLIVQLGMGFQIENLNGHQKKNHYTCDLNVGWTF